MMVRPPRSAPPAGIKLGLCIGAVDPEREGVHLANLLLAAAAVACWVAVLEVAVLERLGRRAGPRSDCFR